MLIETFCSFMQVHLSDYCTHFFAKFRHSVGCCLIVFGMVAMGVNLGHFIILLTPADSGH